MPPISLGRAVCLVLTAAERHRLKKMAYGHKTQHRARQRATVVLLAARGRGNARISAVTLLHVDTVRTWRGRFADGGLPAETGIPLSRWSCPELAAELTARGITDSISASTGGRAVPDARPLRHRRP
ncbi:helix-turn-helix domain-containing protein [Streptomyces mirabilis]|uniref:helix-turn-helix domain-containing protein n=1 Tax=Streptomyces mirabilis TaxID=68239 RepID=UPI0036491254